MEMNKDELDAAILSLEADWKIYHRDPKRYNMPDMMLLTKLRIQRKRIV